MNKKGDKLDLTSNTGDLTNYSKNIIQHPPENRTVVILLK